MKGKTYNFGISGRLYRANVLLYDRETESLWSQVLSEAVTGPMTGVELETLPHSLTTWKRWKKMQPDTLVLSSDTGYSRDYSRDPYGSYYSSPFAFLGFRNKVPGLPEKELVLGIEFEGEKKAYPFSLMKEMKTPIKDNISGKIVTVHFNKDFEDAYVTDDKNRRIPGIVTYWFVWHSFHPKTAIFKK